MTRNPLMKFMKGKRLVRKWQFVPGVSSKFEEELQRYILYF